MTPEFLITTLIVVATPGAGVLFFAAVVVLTMLAAETFDARLIWDAGMRHTPDHG